MSSGGEISKPDSLTLHFDGESVAGRGWDPVAGHTQILPHVQPADLLQPQLGTLQDVKLFPGKQDVVPVLSPPDDVRWRIATSIAGQSDVIPLSHHHVLCLPGLDYGGGDWKVKCDMRQITELASTYLQPAHSQTCAPSGQCLSERRFQKS